MTQKQALAKPKIVCICGSTRFADLHAIKRWELEKDGKAICLMINYLPKWYAEQEGWKEPAHLGEQAGNKHILDELHLRKIDLADEVFVINKDGYIGESTKHEIEYAKSKGKSVYYLETEEDCPICHGEGVVMDSDDPCTECDGSGKVGGEMK